MKIVITGLQPDFDLDALRERMTHFGPVIDVRAVREGNPDQPWAIVEMAVDAGRANEVARRIDGTYHIDRFIRARVMTHG